MLVINAITLGLETSKSLSEETHNHLVQLDKIILIILVVEVALRIIAHGFKFFKEAWNIFDFIVTAIALTPSAGPFAILRAFRVLRVLRILSAVPRFRRIIATILNSIPGIFSVLMVMLLFFYVFAVIGVNLFAPDFPATFGNLARTMFTLFQTMTGGGWAGPIARPVMEIYPYAWLYFVSFILINTFILLNLVMVILISSMRELDTRTRASDPKNFNPKKVRGKK